MVKRSNQLLICTPGTNKYTAGESTVHQCSEDTNAANQRLLQITVIHLHTQLKILLTKHITAATLSLQQRYSHTLHFILHPYSPPPNSQSST